MYHSNYLVFDVDSIWFDLLKPVHQKWQRIVKQDPYRDLPRRHHQTTHDLDPASTSLLFPTGAHRLHPRAAPRPLKPPPSPLPSMRLLVIAPRVTCILTCTAPCHRGVCRRPHARRRGSASRRSPPVGRDDSLGPDICFQIAPALRAC